MKALALLALLGFLPMSAKPDGRFATAPAINLGKPTNSEPAPPNGPLGVFRRTGPVLTQGGKPELLFMGTMVDNGSAIERWALVKALEQFGAFAGITPAQTRSCSFTEVQPTPRCGPPGDQHGFPSGDATLNLERAKYHSAYLAFISTDLIDTQLHVLHKLPPSEGRLFRQYVSNTPGSSAANADSAGNIWNTAINSLEDRRQFPLVSIGGYLQTYVGAAVPGDLSASNEVILPFATVQETLRNGRPTGNVPASNGGRTPGKVVPSLVPDVNAESNVITALICHADRSRPRSVCSRAVIKGLLKQVR